MPSESRLAGKLLAMHQILAFLMAREAARSGVAFTELHKAFISEAYDSYKPFSGQPEAGQIEAAMIAELDSLFAMAEVYRRAMPDK